MSENRLITVAIHTYERAIALKSLLESEGIDVALQNVNLEQPVVSSGVRVRIKECDLPLALRIIENIDIFSSTHENRPDKAVAPILVPTDFSEYSFKATTKGFKIAHRLKAPIVFIHSFIDPSRTGKLQLTDAFSYDVFDSEERKAIERQSYEAMTSFTTEIKERIKKEALPPVKFSTIIVEGVPEESICEYSKDNPVTLIVMGTRGTGKKERQMVGSVTAEVLDSCRVPVLTVPESQPTDKSKEIKDIIFFSNLDQEDILALDALYRLYPDSEFKVTIVHIPGKKENKATTSKGIDALLNYCQSHYPSYQFNVKNVMLDTIVEDFKAIAQEQPIDLIAIPNKKRNIFARLFNPSIAHKLLFHADIPLLAIPV